MGANTRIAYVHHTFNPWWGCERRGEGCVNCYARALAWRFRSQLQLWVPKTWGETPERMVVGQRCWDAPLDWNRDAQAADERRRVLCMSMGDIFEADESQRMVDSRGKSAATTLSALRADAFRLIEGTPWLDWLLLTKRIENVAAMVPWASSWPANAWLGFSASTQAELSRGLPTLSGIAARIRFVSLEPLLEAIEPEMASLCGRILGWVIIGCESGAKRRPCELEWARGPVIRYRELGIPVFVKQLSINGKVSRDPAEWPDDLRVQELPLTHMPPPAKNTASIDWHSNANQSRDGPGAPAGLLLR